MMVPWWVGIGLWTVAMILILFGHLALGMLFFMLSVPALLRSI